MLKAAIAGIGLLLAIAAPQQSSAMPVTEGRDAGNMLATANSYTGNQEITRINGRKGRRQGVDMFEIFIQDTNDFFARVTRFAGLDTQLFLFNKDGFGVIANDNRNRNDDLSRLGSFAGTSGLYYLAISGFGVDPVSGTDDIFPDRPRRRILDANAGAGALTGWTRGGIANNTGTYRINLRGAFTSDYVAVSEPATVGLLGLALVGLATLRRRKSA